MTPGEGGGTSRADPADLPTVYGPQRLLQRLPRSAESANRPIGGVIRPGEGRGLGPVVMGHGAIGRSAKLAHRRGYEARRGHMGLGAIGSLCFVVAMAIHRHISTHWQSSKKGVRWPKLGELTAYSQHVLATVASSGSCQLAALPQHSHNCCEYS